MLDWKRGVSKATRVGIRTKIGNISNLFGNISNSIVKFPIRFFKCPFHCSFPWKSNQAHVAPGFRCISPETLTRIVPWFVQWLKMRGEAWEKCVSTCAIRFCIDILLFINKHPCAHRNKKHSCECWSLRAPKGLWCAPGENLQDSILPTTFSRLGQDTCRHMRSDSRLTFQTVRPPIVF